jgi:general secretion pathway protein D
MEGIAGRKYNYFRALQLEQQSGGINLMPDSNVPILDEWDQDTYVPDDVNQVLERYKNGKGLETQMRETDPALRSINESKQTNDINDSEQNDD